MLVFGSKLVLDANPEIKDLALADPTQGKRTDTGRREMTMEKVLRFAILGKIHNLTYNDLLQWIADPN